MFPKTWNETNNSFISDLIKNPSCFSDKEQEAQFIHSLDVCLSFLHPCDLDSSETQNVPTFFAKLPMALLEFRQKSSFYLLSTKRLRKISWRQPEFRPLAGSALREFDSSSQSILDRLEVKYTREIQVNLECYASPHWDKSGTDKTDDCQEFQIVQCQCLELRYTKYVNHDCWFKPTGLSAFKRIYLTFVV